MSNFRKKLFPAYKANRRPLPTCHAESRIYRTEDGWRAVAFDSKRDTKLVDIFIAEEPGRDTKYIVVRALLENALLNLNAKEVKFFPPTPRPG